MNSGIRSIWLSLASIAAAIREPTRLVIARLIRPEPSSLAISACACSAAVSNVSGGISAASSIWPGSIMLGLPESKSGCRWARLLRPAQCGWKWQCPARSRRGLNSWLAHWDLLQFRSPTSAWARTSAAQVLPARQHPPRSPARTTTADYGQGEASSPVPPVVFQPPQPRVQAQALAVGRAQLGWVRSPPMQAAEPALVWP